MGTISKAVWYALCCSLVSGQAMTAVVKKERLESVATTRFEWEVLWRTSNFLPDQRSVEVAFFSNNHAFAFCAIEFGMCAWYRSESATKPHPNEAGSIVLTRDFGREITNTQALSSYLKGLERERVTTSSGSLTASISELPTRGTKSLHNFLRGETWTKRISLRGRLNIEQAYKQLRPEGLDALTGWFRSRVQNANPPYLNATIACYSELDPSVFVYAETVDGPLVMTFNTNLESGLWQLASLTDQRQGGNAFGTLANRVNSLPCAVLTFTNAPQ